MAQISSVGGLLHQILDAATQNFSKSNISIFLAGQTVRRNCFAEKIEFEKKKNEIENKKRTKCAKKVVER